MADGGPASDDERYVAADNPGAWERTRGKRGGRRQSVIAFNREWFEEDEAAPRARLSGPRQPPAAPAYGRQERNARSRDRQRALQHSEAARADAHWWREKALEDRRQAERRRSRIHI